MKACASCLNLHRFAQPIEARGMLIAGACVAHINTPRAPLVSESCGSMCADFEAIETRVIDQVCLEEEGAA